MPRVFPKAAVIAAGAAGLVALASFPGGPLPGEGVAAAQEAKQDAATSPEVQELLDKTKAAVRNCQLCHNNAQAAAAADKNILKLVRMDESEFWNMHDWHRRACMDSEDGSVKGALETPTARQMGKILGYKDVTKQNECLVCHAVDLKPEEPLASKKFWDKEGVNCAACHGFDKGWVAPHANSPWRNVPPKEKMSFGQFDLRDPEVRATKCLSCHVGNHAEGKVLSHAMYAAGHPPLPGFETMRFSLDQPAHWKLPKETQYFQELVKDEKTVNGKTGVQRAWDYFHFRADESQLARITAIGALVTLRETVKLIGDEAKACVEAVKKKAADGQSLDIAHFDCYACHHELRRPSWRQERGYPGRAPGRPVMRPVPTELVKIVVNDPAAAKTLDGLLGGLNKAFDLQPFGEPEAVAKAADALIGWANAEIAKAKTGFMYNTAECDRIRKAIARALADAGKAPNHLDYDTTRQLVWAFNTLNGEAGGSGQFKAELEQVDKIVPPNVRGKADYTAESLMRERMRLISEFEPSSLRKPFEAIYKSLGGDANARK